MKIEILDEAQADLVDGFHFYERQQPGLGTYFIDCLFSDVDALIIFGGVHERVYGYRRAFQ